MFEDHETLKAFSYTRKFAAKCPAMVPNQRSSHSCCAVPAVADSSRLATMAWKIRKQVGSIYIYIYIRNPALYSMDAWCKIYCIQCIHLYIILCVCYICLHYIWNKIIIWKKYINHQTHWKHHEIHPFPTQKKPWSPALRWPFWAALKVHAEDFSASRRTPMPCWYLGSSGWWL